MKTNLWWKKNKWLIRLTLFLLLALFLSIKIIGLIDDHLKPTLSKIAESQTKAIATNLINQTIHKEIIEHIRYEELVNIKTDNNGRVVMMQPNTREINRLATRMTTKIQDALKSMEQEEIRIPLAQVFNNQLLAGIGPWIKVQVYPMGTVDAAIVDRFQEAGINQTRHMVYLRTLAQVRIVVPLVTTQVEIPSEMLIAETIIVGEVPKYYMNYGREKKSVDNYAVE